MIPKILHYVWVGGSLPAHLQGYIDSWRETNPDYQIICWNESNIDMQHPAVRRCYRAKQWVKVSDFVRHLAVYQMGGIYLDTDFRLYKPLDSLLSHKCFYGFQHEHDHPDWIANGAFGAEAGHRFIGQAIQRMTEIEGTLVGHTRMTSLGPKFITAMLRMEGLKTYSPNGVIVGGDIFLCPTHWFYPFTYGETFSPECLRPDTLAAHFWEASWIKKPTLTRKAIRLLLGATKRISA